MFMSVSSVGGGRLTKMELSYGYVAEFRNSQASSLNSQPWLKSCIARLDLSRSNILIDFIQDEVTQLSR
jgi:hypothetical protein